MELNGVLFGSDCVTQIYTGDVFMFSCLLFIGTFLIAMSLKSFRNTRFFPNMVMIYKNWTIYVTVYYKY